MIISLIRPHSSIGSLLTCVFLYYKSSGSLPIISMVLRVMWRLICLVCSLDCGRDSSLYYLSYLFSFLVYLVLCFYTFFEVQIIFPNTELTRFPIAILGEAYVGITVLPLDLFVR